MFEEIKLFFFKEVWKISRNVDKVGVRFFFIRVDQFTFHYLHMQCLLCTDRGCKDLDVRIFEFVARTPCFYLYFSFFSFCFMHHPISFNTFNFLGKRRKIEEGSGGVGVNMRIFREIVTESHHQSYLHSHISII